MEWVEKGRILFWILVIFLMVILCSSLYIKENWLWILYFRIKKIVKLIVSWNRCILKFLYRKCDCKYLCWK